MLTAGMGLGKGVVPEGHSTIAQRFSVGLGTAAGRVPKGRPIRERRRSASAVPSGLGSRLISFPTLKRWAILKCPYGTSARTNNPRAGGYTRGLLLVILLLCVASTRASSFEDLFNDGTQSYKSGQYARASDAFAKSAAEHPASGTLLNLGLSEWQRGKVGPAICAWEQAAWVNPYGEAARTNLKFARKSAQLEAPDLAWYEVVSTWLPADWWAWITGVSLWLAIAMVTLPGILRQPRRTWHQAAAAFGLMVFLLSVPAHMGVRSRTCIGFVLQKETPLRLTPTTDAQVLTRLQAGQPARVESAHGRFILVRAGSEGTRGWLDRSQLFMIGASVPYAPGAD